MEAVVFIGVQGTGQSSFVVDNTTPRVENRSRGGNDAFVVQEEPRP